MYINSSPKSRAKRSDLDGSGRGQTRQGFCGAAEEILRLSEKPWFIRDNKREDRGRGPLFFHPKVEEWWILPPAPAILKCQKWIAKRWILILYKWVVSETIRFQLSIHIFEHLFTSNKEMGTSFQVFPSSLYIFRCSFKKFLIPATTSGGPIICERNPKVATHA